MNRSFHPQEGAVLGRWTLKEVLGRGAFGSTWSAQDTSGEQGAVKLLRTAPGDELRALDRICHPSVVGVLDAGLHPVPYVVMELVPGRPLSVLLKAGPPPLQLATTLFATMADALAAVHRANLVHGDLKPDNVIVDNIQAHRVALVDLGLAGGGYGGNLEYAAPERISGEPAAPAADVYALGLLCWEVLHGHRPWRDVPLASSLNLRRSETPAATEGPPWLRDLLGRVLCADPANRLSAAGFADALEAHGATRPAVDAPLIRRRARRTNVSRPGLTDAVERWLGRGGTLALEGPDGSGRSHVLARIGVELHARGIPWIRISPGGPPWAPIERALSDPSLPTAFRPLPRASTRDERARIAAVDLVDRFGSEVCVLADDFDKLDPGSRATVEALARIGRVRLCVGTSTSPTWIPDRVPLDPLDESGMDELLQRLLGQVVERERVVRRLLDCTAGMPGRAVALIIEAVEQGVITCRAHRWIVDEVGLARLMDARHEPRIEGLSAPARQLGALVAAHPHSLSRTEIQAEVPTTGQECSLASLLSELADAGLVRLEADQVRPVDPAARTALLAAVDDAPALHRRLLERLLLEPHTPWLRLGRHLLGAGDRELVHQHGPAAIEGLIQVDPADAARLAEALWSAFPDRDLAASRVGAMVAAGEIDDARAFCEQVLASGQDADHLPLLVALASIELHHAGDDDATLALIARAWEAVGEQTAPAELLITSAQAHFRAGRLDEAVETARLLADRPPPSEDKALDHWLALRGTWAQAVHRSGDVTAAVAILESVPAALGEGRASRAILDANLGRLLWHAGRMRQAAHSLTRASRADAGLPALERARLLNNAGLASYEVGDLNVALDRWESALLLAERMDAQLELVRLQNNLCVGYREARRWERSRQAGEWVLERAGELGAAEFQAMASGNLGDLCVARGQLAAAPIWFDRCEAIAQANDLRDEMVEVARRRAELAVRIEADDATEICENALGIALEAGSQVEEARVLALRGLCRARAGEATGARRDLAAAEAILRTVGATRDLAWVRLWAGETWAALGEDEEARDALSSAEAYAGECGHALLRHEARERLVQISTTALPSAEDRRILHLLDLVAVVLGRHDPEALLSEVARAALDVLDGDRAVVLLGPKADRQVGLATAGGKEPPGPPSRTVVERCLASHRAVIAVDVAERADLRAATSVVSLGLRSVMCVPLLHNDELMGVIYVDSRSSSARRMEAAEELVSALARMGAAALGATQRLEQATTRVRGAAELAHDLRNPLASIAAIATRQALPDAEPAGAQTWEDLRRLCMRADGMVGSWLDGEERPRSAVDLRQLTDELLRTRAPVAAGRGVLLEAADLPQRAMVLGDLEQLERALQNLLVNAIKYAPGGTVVTVGITEERAGYTWWVQDRGRGLPPDLQVAILDLGVQGPGAEPGHGLGLAITHRVVQAHGGSLVAGNHEQGGAEFRLWLPALISGAATG